MKRYLSKTPGSRSHPAALLALLLGLALLTVFPFSPASADCQKYLTETGAVPGQESCMLRCASGRKNLATYACGNQCAEFCGKAPPEDECQAEVEELQEYVADWERDMEDMKWPLFSADDKAWLRQIGNFIASGLRGYAITKTGAPSSLEPVVVNSGHLKRILTADNEREQAAAGLDLYFSVATSFIPRGGSPDSAGARLDRVKGAFLDFINAGDNPEAMKAEVEDLYRRQQSPACNGGGSGLETYKP